MDHSSTTEESSWDAPGAVTTEVVKKSTTEEEIIPVVVKSSLQNVRKSITIAADTVASRSGEEDEEEDEDEEVVTTAEAAAFPTTPIATAKKVTFEPTFGVEDFDKKAESDSEEESAKELLQSKCGKEEKKKDEDEDEEEEDEGIAFSSFAATPTSGLSTLLNNDIEKPVTRSVTAAVSGELWSSGAFMFACEPKVIMSTVATELSQCRDAPAAATLLLRAVLTGIHELCTSAPSKSQDFNKSLSTIGTAANQSGNIETTLSKYILAAPNVALGTQMITATKNFARIPLVHVHENIAQNKCTVENALKALTSIAHVAAAVLGASQHDEHKQWTHSMLRASAAYCSSLDVLTTSAKRQVEYNRFVQQKEQAIPTVPLTRLQRIALELEK